MDHISVNSSDMPNLSAQKLLRKLDELRNGGKFGRNLTQDEADIGEFTGNMG